MAKATVSLKMVSLIWLLVIITLADFGSTFGVNAQSTPICDQVVSVQNGDTCVALAQIFNISSTFFDAMNPNLNCTRLFVGQWLCVDGTPN